MSEVVQDFLYGIDTGALQYSRYSTMDSTKSPERQLALASGLIKSVGYVRRGTIPQRGTSHAEKQINTALNAGRTSYGQFAQILNFQKGRKPIRLITIPLARSRAKVRFKK